MERSRERERCGEEREKRRMGQMTVFAHFGEDFHLPEDAEFYFVYNGSSHRHVSFAERLSANSLQSIFPGHNCPESLSVTVCMHTHGYSPVIVASTSVSYVMDKACSISHSLKSHCDRLTSSSHQTILDKFDVTPQDLTFLDRNMTLCLAHEDYMPSWNILGSYAESGLDFCDIDFLPTNPHLHLVSTSPEESFLGRIDMICKSNVTFSVTFCLLGKVQ
ncbi:unnamed protein product [Ranitomeya imitator]|uniref:Recombination activating protein 2 n=1 Tax=Ranitomeya imitator TaxID=111125 RepID=A0ABN9KZK2_9NEOB|nr:unnamed protein product [Ranitomeya imitator]